MFCGLNPINIWIFSRYLNPFSLSSKVFILETNEFYFFKSYANVMFMIPEPFVAKIYVVLMCMI